MERFTCSTLGCQSEIKYYQEQNGMFYCENCKVNDREIMKIGSVRKIEDYIEDCEEILKKSEKLIVKQIEKISRIKQRKKIEEQYSKLHQFKIEVEALDDDNVVETTKFLNKCIKTRREIKEIRNECKQLYSEAHYHSMSDSEEEKN